jgi:hypothetical protein
MCFQLYGVENIQSRGVFHHHHRLLFANLKAKFADLSPGFADLTRAALASNCQLL